MLDALFIKELLNLSVLEFGPIITSHFLDGETGLLLSSSNKWLHFVPNLELIKQEKYPSEIGIVINNNKTIFVTLILR
jgi:hypothetical protein